MVSKCVRKQPVWLNQPTKEKNLTIPTRYNLETKLSIFPIRNFVLSISDEKLVLSRIYSYWNYEWLPWGEICICQNIAQFQFKITTYSTPYRLRHEIKRSKPKLCKTIDIKGFPTWKFQVSNTPDIIGLAKFNFDLKLVCINICNNKILIQF